MTTTPELSKRQVEILTALRARCGQGRAWTTRGFLKSSFTFLQRMYFLDLVDGAGSDDANGMGNTPDSSWWIITPKGMETLAAFERQKAVAPS